MVAPVNQSAADIARLLGIAEEDAREILDVQAEFQKHEDKLRRFLSLIGLGGQGTPSPDDLQNLVAFAEMFKTDNPIDQLTQAGMDLNAQIGRLEASVAATERAVSADEQGLAQHVLAVSAAEANLIALRELVRQRGGQV
jgi:hypothetical protein